MYPRTPTSMAGTTRDFQFFAEAIAAAVVGPPRSGLGRGLLVAGSSLGVAAAILALSLVPVGGLFFPQPPTVAL